MSAIHVRPECAADADVIRAITRAAFKDHPYSKQTEHLLVDALRAAGALTVSLVAELDGEVVGHIAFSPALIDGQACGWCGAGPLSVRPDRQRQGVGKALVRRGLELLREKGCRGCVLVGDPAYYVRFGFRADPRIRYKGVPPQYVLSLALDGEETCGEVTFHPAFAACA